MTLAGAVLVGLNIAGTREYLGFSRNAGTQYIGFPLRFYEYHISFPEEASKEDFILLRKTSATIPGNWTDIYLIAIAVDICFFGIAVVGMGFVVQKESLS